MAKQITCECGDVIRGDTDDEVVDGARDHMRTDHPDLLRQGLRRRPPRLDRGGLAMATVTFDPGAYKETTRAQWQDAASAWHRWDPVFDRWLGRGDRAHARPRGRRRRARA